MNGNASSASLESIQSPDTSAITTIGSLWRRTVAYLTDGFFLGFIGFAAGTALSGTFSKMGPWGRAVGFCIAIAYFSYFDSKAGNGQTPGKRWLKLQVLNVAGAKLTFSSALIRSIIFEAPALLVGLSLPLPRASWIASALVAVVLYGVGGSTLYLLIFNRHTRQGLHELAVGSYVVNAAQGGTVHTKPIWKVHWAILPSALLLFALAAGVVQRKIENVPSLRQMSKDALLIEEMNGVQQAHLSDFLTRGKGTIGAEKVLNANVILADGISDQATFASDAAKLILQNDQYAQKYDEITIRTFQGYDIGIAQHWSRHVFTHTPSEWRERALGSSPSGAANSSR